MANAVDENMAGAKVRIEQAERRSKAWLDAPTAVALKEGICGVGGCHADCAAKGKAREVRHQAHGLIHGNVRAGQTALRIRETPLL
jgi:hypothetical protein